MICAVADNHKQNSISVNLDRWECYVLSRVVELFQISNCGSTDFVRCCIRKQKEMLERVPVFERLHDAV